jgi:hypothetical protein
MLSVQCRWALIFCGLLGLCSSAQAKDAFVVLSGGGTPTSNHYSQYLQARAYVTYLRAHYPEDSIWVFFGAGNVSGQSPELADVEHTTQDAKGHDVTTWLPGALPGNHPARHDVIARLFRDEILPAVKDGGTLYLFVGDHGAPSGGADPESIISLWSWGRDPTARFGWRQYPWSETLGVAELRRWLSAGLGEGRVAFVMSQCYSGGFHYLGLPRQVAPNPAWFTRAPHWVTAIAAPKAQPAVAGFTATDDHSVASGCTSDVSADHWAGYERYLPENLLGLDLFTLQPGAKPARNSFYDAHLQAVDADRTIDKPRATSEQYLKLWADTIERMVKDPHLGEPAKAALAKFRTAMNGIALQTTDPALKSREQEYRRIVDRMLAGNSELADLRQASAQALESAMKSETTGAAGFDPAWRARMLAGAETEDEDENPAATDAKVAQWLWMREIAPAWRKALEADEIADLPANVAEFERELVALETRQAAREMHADMTGAAIDPQMLVYYFGGYTDPQTFDPARAKAVADWPSKRGAAIIAWAKKSTEVRVRVAAEAFALWMPTQAAGDGVAAKAAAEKTAKVTSDAARNASARPKPSPLQRKVAAERLYLYRQVLAAWQFLLDMGERPALERVAALTQLERTPLPSGLGTEAHE